MAPASLEDLLLSHPAIQEAAVVGKPDPEAGELPCAFVILKPGHQDTQPADIDDFIKGMGTTLTREEVLIQLNINTKTMFIVKTHHGSVSFVL